MTIDHVENLNLTSQICCQTDLLFVVMFCHAAVAFTSCTARKLEEVVCPSPWQDFSSKLASSPRDISYIFHIFVHGFCGMRIFVSYAEIIQLGDG